MIFQRIFKRGLYDSDPDIRIQELEKAGVQKLFLKFALEDPDTRVRVSVAELLTDESLLEKLIETSNKPEVQDCARKVLAKRMQLAEIASDSVTPERLVLIALYGEDEVIETAIQRIKSKTDLEQIISLRKGGETAFEAANSRLIEFPKENSNSGKLKKKLPQEDELKSVNKEKPSQEDRFRELMEEGDPDKGRKILTRISKDDLLFSYSLYGKDDDLRIEAALKIVSVEYLRKILEYGNRDERIISIAIESLRELGHEAEIPSPPKPTKKKTARKKRTTRKKSLKPIEKLSDREVLLELENYLEKHDKDGAMRQLLDMGMSKRQVLEYCRTSVRIGSLDTPENDSKKGENKLQKKTNRNKRKSGDSAAKSSKKVAEITKKIKGIKSQIKEKPSKNPLGVSVDKASDTLQRALESSNSEGNNKIRHWVEIGGDASWCNSYGVSLLHWASNEGNVSMVEFLINHGADVNAKRSKGFTPLHFACQRWWPKIISLLLEGGADPNAEWKGKTPLGLLGSVYHEDARILEKAMIQKGATTIIGETRDCPNCGSPKSALMKKRNVWVTLNGVFVRYLCKKCKIDQEIPLHSIHKQNGVSVECSSCRSIVHIKPQSWCKTCGGSLSTGWERFLHYDH